MSYYLAIDMGASSGRHILGSIEDGKIKLEEIYRFENGISKIGDEYCWDIQGLFNEIKKGIKKCKEIGKVPKTIGIDTWAVDFVLLDENDEMLGNAVAYRGIYGKSISSYSARYVVFIHRNTIPKI